MTAVISLLRGINLGSHRRVKMEPLKAVYESLGLTAPQHYLQSGNVVFQTRAADLPRLAARLEAAIEKAFGFHSDIILRTAAEWHDLITHNPFADRPNLDPARYLVWFLASPPSAQACDGIRALSTSAEEIRVGARELYIYFSNGLARPKLSMAQVEKLAACSGTGRNWNTVMKLRDLAASLG